VTDVLQLLEQLRATEKRVAMATLMAARGGSPRPVGTKMFVAEGGRLVGSISIGGCVDAKIVEHGERLLREDRWEVVTAAMDDAEAVELGLACGAEFDLLIEPVDLGADGEIASAYRAATQISAAGREAFVRTELAGRRPTRTVSSERPTDRKDVFVERIAPAQTLIIVGGSDVGIAVARVAKVAGLRVVVVEGRERLATRDRFPDADEILVGIPSELVRPQLNSAAHVVLLTHDYKYEMPVLRDALRSDARYVGMLAGRKRAEGVRTMLRDEGLSESELGRLHAPVGLDIGGREPGEIAVSIVAQIIATREGRPSANKPKTADSSRSSE
jgi:xanthine dehydrogenase accessory factor